jgi:DNA-binding NarL/FixJ family response regulator
MSHESVETIALLKHLIEQNETLIRQNQELTKQNCELAEAIRKRLSIGPQGYTVQQVADELRLSAYTVRQMCPDIPGAYKVDGRSSAGEWRITDEGLAAFREARQRKRAG